MLGLKVSYREPRGGWAKGNYINSCLSCGDDFIGDKLAVQCADCAYYNEFKKYKRKEISELRPVTEEDKLYFSIWKNLYISDDLHTVSISDVDLESGSPKIGDMIARNPKNHNDQWLVEEQYFKDNFEELT